MQRYLSPEEYAALGYELKQDIRFKDGSYTTRTYGIDLPDFAYRAETKEEYAIDLGVGIAKVTWAYATGGFGPAGKTAVMYLYSLVQ